MGKSSSSQLVSSGVAILGKNGISTMFLSLSPPHTIYSDDDRDGVIINDRVHVALQTHTK